MSGDPFVRQVREAVDLVEVVGRYVELKRAGKSWKGRCPFHEEKTPSFNVNPDQQLFYCFGCQKGGDVFRFLMDLEHLTFPETLERLAKQANVPLPPRRARSREEIGLAEVVEFAVRYYEEELRHPERGREGRALLRSRGIKADTAVRYRLGYAGPGWENLVRAAQGRFPAELLLQAGLCVQKEGGAGLYDRLRRRVVIPIQSAGGVIVGLAGRAVAGSEVKYLNTSDSPLYHKSSVLYGLAQARPSIRQNQRALLVEGYLDVLTLHQAGFTEAVASSGTALTLEHGRLLRRYTDQVVVVYDGDDAGRAAAFRGLRPLLRAGIRPRLALLPPGSDPDSLVRDQGADALRAALEEAQDWLVAVRRHPGLPDRFEARLEAVAGLLSEVEDDLLRAAFTQEAAREFSFFEDVLRAAVEKRHKVALATASASGGGRQMRPAPRNRAEWSLLRWFYHRPELLRSMGGNVREEWFEGPLERRFFGALRSMIEDPLGATPPELLPLAAEAPDEEFPVERGVEYALTLLEERWLQREIKSLRNTLPDLPEGEERQRRIAEIQAGMERAQALVERARDAQFETLGKVFQDGAGA